MKTKGRFLVLALLAVILLGMASCMKTACPAYASTTEKTQNNRG